MMEYNADTPSLLLESSAVQKEWFQDTLTDSNQQQSNYILSILEFAMKEIYKECIQDWNAKNVKTKPGQFSFTPKIGVLTIDFDDESAA